MTFLSSWRTALRVARREARRAKGRSGLVIAMIALPVLFLTFAAVSYDMFTLTGAEQANRIMGTAAARISWPGRTPVAQMPNPNDGYYQISTPDGPDAIKAVPDSGPAPTEADLRSALPAGTTVLLTLRGTVQLRDPEGAAGLDAVAVDTTNPMTHGYVSIVDGRAPRSGSEVALTEQAMQRLGAGVGDQVRLADGTRSYTVVGQAEFPSLLSSVVLFAPASSGAPAGFDLGGTSWLVQTPGAISWSDVLHDNQLGMVVTSRAVLENPPATKDIPYLQQTQSTVDVRQLEYGVLVGGLALLEIVLMAGPAFAVSARRRQRQLALVAANGATPAQVRRIVLADGVVLGGLGALVGIALGIPAAFAGRPVIEEHLAHARAGGYRVFPTALLAIAALAEVTGVLAAVVPAFITARQNIITSLAGRRGITRSRKRWLVLGIATCALGTFIVTVGTSRVDTRIMLVGIILGELGLVLCTPSLVGLIARVGRLLPLGPRIALRDAARNRAAAAPAISAVMAAVAGSVAIGLYLTSNVAQQRDEYPQRLPIGYVEMYLGKSGGPVSADRLAHADQLLRSSMPVAQTYPVSMQACAPSEPADAYCSLVVRKAPAYTCPYDDIVTSRPLTKAEVHAARADSRCDTNPIGNVSPDVDDGTALAALTGASGDDLRRGQAMLRAGGIVVTDPSYIDNGQVTVEVTEQRPNDTAPPTARSLTLPAYLLTTAFGKGPMIASPKAMQTAGMGSVVTSMVAVTTRMPTTEEQDRLRGTVAGEAGFFVETGPPITVDARIWILMGAAAAITLAAAAVGTALAAADGRQDLSTLAAVGASPRLRRSLSLSQSGVIAGLGSLLGALAGTGAAVAILAAFNATIRDEWPGPPTMPVALPWAALIVALLVVPSIAMIGAGTLTGSRLPIERRT